MDSERRAHFEELQRALAAVPDTPAPGAGRGIVTCGSARLAPDLWVLVRSLRFHGCALPIEVWHLAGELTDPLRRLLEPEGVSFRLAPDAAGRHASHARALHALKPYAMAHSAFREILFLDADNAVFRDPSFLFDTAEFRRHRAVFWPDRLALARPLGGPQLRRDFGLRDDGSAEFESGQIVLDKVDHWRALTLTRHLNERSRYYYRFLYGDKETFRLAFDLVGGGYFLVPRPPTFVRGLAHVWIDGQRLFHHRAGGAKRRLLRPGNLPALPRAEARASLRVLAPHWKAMAPRRERLAVYPRALRQYASDAAHLLIHPRLLVAAVGKRLRRGPGWAGDAVPGEPSGTGRRHEPLV